MRLQVLLAGLPAYRLKGPSNPEILGLTDDSRRVKPGWLFACVRGRDHDGHDYAPEALAAGAVALLVEEPVVVPEGASVIVVPDTRPALAEMAGIFAGRPSRSLRLYGVTGTNGKTTTAAMAEWIMNANAHPTGLIGTIRNHVGPTVRPARQTTPGPIEFQGLLAEMVAGGLQACVAEISSHALVQQRVAGTRFAAAVLTNVARDHFDFHRDYRSYLQAKSRLFAELLPPGHPAVLNRDDPSFPAIRAVCRGPVLQYGFDPAADVRGIIEWSGPTKQSLRVERAGEALSFRLPLPGQANAANALAALTLVSLEGISLTAAAEALERFPGLPGRFETIDGGQDFTVLVDYAHNPAALRQLLRTVRCHTRGRVILVFGCEGGKDRGKRHLMGEIAADAADHAIITCDNLHDEEAWPIFAAVRAGFLQGRRGTRPCYRLFYSRREAIARALRMARAGDTVVIAGKGHETELVVGRLALPFDDRSVAREVLSEMHRS